MKDYTIDEPVFSESISITETTDQAHAENINAATKQLLQNTLANRNNINYNCAKKSIYGDDTVSMGRESGTTAGSKSFAFGNNVEASGDKSAVLGGSYGKATGYNSVVIGGEVNDASDWSACLGGGYNSASGNFAASVGGYTNTASGEHAVVLGGTENTASGVNSASIGGVDNIANNYSSVSIGKFSKSMGEGGTVSNQIGDVFTIGNGYATGTLQHSNAMRVTYLGDILGTKAFQSSGADYAEFIKPWADGNQDSEDRIGYFVTVKDGLLHKADAGDYIAGITSGNPSVVGNADEDYYWRYERDEFNRIIMEDVPELVQETDENGKPVFDAKTHEPVMVETGRIISNARMKLAEDYDPSLQESYIERKNRKEWDYVGMVGVLPVRDDGTCIPGQFCRCGSGGIATLAEKRDFDTYMVIERISENVVSVILK